MKYNTLFLSIFLCVFSHINSQSIERFLVSSSGQTYIKNDMQLSFSIGELVISTKESENVVLTQGIHQSTLITTDVSENFNLDFDIKVYPNPVISILNIEVNSDKLPILYYKLHTLNGFLIKSDIIRERKFSIDFLKQEQGIYLFSICNEEGEILKYCKLKVTK